MSEARYARVAGAFFRTDGSDLPQGADQVARYMPDNYEVGGYAEIDGKTYVIIAGHDRAGWTLDDYVIPRLASGLYWCEEIEVRAVVEAREAKRDAVLWRQDARA